MNEVTSESFISLEIKYNKRGVRPPKIGME
jgi:hypothetical protein